MLKRRPVLVLPRFPKFRRFSFKLAMGLFCLIFFLDYQPTLAFPPVKQNKVLAQAQQNETIEAKSLPFSFQLPHPGYLSTRYSSYHPGIDLASGLGMPVKPIASGTVTSSGYNFWGLGLVVEIEHGQGYKSLYAHLGRIFVKTGQLIEPTDLLGEVGLTGNTSGPHTHIEVYKEGKTIDPVAILPIMRTEALASDLTPLGGKVTVLTTPPSVTPQQTPSLKAPGKTLFTLKPVEKPTFAPQPTFDLNLVGTIQTATNLDGSLKLF